MSARGRVSAWGQTDTCENIATVADGKNVFVAVLNVNSETCRHGNQRNVKQTLRIVRSVMRAIRNRKQSRNFTDSPRNNANTAIKFSSSKVIKMETSEKQLSLRERVLLLGAIRLKQLKAIMHLS